MSVTLKIPFVTQLKIGGHITGGETRDDPTGCWYASACMVAYYFGAGPRLGVPELFRLQLGGGQLGHHATGSKKAKQFSPQHHELLASREGLKPVSKCGTSHRYTLDELEDLLRKGGPIFMYWGKQHGGGSVRPRLRHHRHDEHGHHLPRPRERSERAHVHRTVQRGAAEVEVRSHATGRSGWNRRAACHVRRLMIRLESRTEAVRIARKPA